MNKPIKVIFDATPIAASQKTGVGWLGYRLISHLAKNYPKDVILVGYYYNFLKLKRVDLPKANNIVYKPIILYPGKVTNLLRRWRINLPMEFLAKSKGDAGLFVNFLSQPSLFKKPTIPFIHDLSYLYYPAFASDKNRQDLERFIPKTVNKSAAIMTCSKFSKQTIAKEFNYPLDKILVAYAPPEEPDNKAKNKIAAVKKKFSINKSYILFVGTLEPRKNLTNLVEAYGLSPYLQKNYALVIAGGTDWKYAETVEKIKELQEKGLDIIQTGYVELGERNALYAGASLFVMPSHFEGFGMPILEAFTYGIPVCLSNIPVFHEVAGDAALYFDKDKPKSIAGTIESLLKDKLKSQQLVVKGKKRLRSYSWDKISRDVYELIQKISN